MPRAASSPARRSVKCSPAVGAPPAPAPRADHGLETVAPPPPLGVRLGGPGRGTRERKSPLPRLAFRLDDGVELAVEAAAALALPLLSETHHVAGLELAGGLDQRLPARAVKPFDQRRLD